MSGDDVQLRPTLVSDRDEFVAEHGVGVVSGAVDQGDVALTGSVELAEISGSDTFVHVDTPIGELVAQLTGVHVFKLGETVTLYIHPAQAYVFGSDGNLLVAATGN